MEEPIDLNQYIEIREFIEKHLLIAIELERDIPVERTIVAKALETNSFGKDYIHNDFTCDTDGSVTNHNEVILCGKNFTFKKLYERLRFFEDRISKLDASPQNSTCSSHISFFSLHTMRMPDTFIKNIIQLTRAYQLPLFYLGGGDNKYIVRYRLGQFCKPIYKRTVLGKTLDDLRTGLAKYSIISMRKTLIEDNCALRFSIEFRNPDGIRVPSALAAIAFLKKALIKKALHLSTKGVIDADKHIGIHAWNKEKNIFRVYDTISLDAIISTDGQDTFKKSAHKLLDYLQKEILEEHDGELIMQVLRNLADRNISLRYHKKQISNRFNQEIDKELLGNKYKVKDINLSDKEQKVLKYLLDFDADLQNFKELYQKMAADTEISERTLHDIVSSLEFTLGKKLIIVERKVVLR